MPLNAASLWCVNHLLRNDSFGSRRTSPFTCTTVRNEAFAAGSQKDSLRTKESG